MDRETLYLYWLCQSRYLGAAGIDKLYQHYGSYEQVFLSFEADKRQIANPKLFDDLVQKKREFHKITQSYHTLGEQGIAFITHLDRRYPERLHQIAQRPAAIYIKGCLPDETKKTAAIIGARNCSNYGRESAEFFAYELSSANVQIISGLAYGIDAAGHRGAVAGGEKTFGVLGCGVNICYPKEHFSLYQKIITNGGVISEFAPGCPPKPFHFPMRNRLISGLADLIIVIEAKENSGSLITVEYALDQGKDVFALPGRIIDPLSQGCLQLIQTGANLLISPTDILDYLGLKSEKILRVQEKNINRLAKKEKIVYSCLDLTEKNMEQIIKETGLSASECMNVLLDLELQGLINRTSGHYYVKKR